MGVALAEGLARMSLFGHGNVGSVLNRIWAVCFTGATDGHFLEGAGAERWQTLERDRPSCLKGLLLQPCVATCVTGMIRVQPLARATPAQALKRLLDEAGAASGTASGAVRA